jgi:hypothetical protein
MLKDILIGFGDNMRSRTTNPFFGTFIIVWIIRNWQLIITLFNLDLYTTLDKKFEVLKAYFVDKDILWGLFQNTWISIVAIVGTYAVLNLSRAIINLFENHVTPWVYKVTMPGQIILRSEYNKMLNKYEELQARYDAEKVKRTRAEEEQDRIEKRLQAYLSNTNEHQAGIKIDFEQIYSIMLENDALEGFIDDVEEVLKGKPVRTYSVGLILQLGLFEKTKDLSEDEAYFKLTSKGSKYWDYLISKNEIGKKR